MKFLVTSKKKATMKCNREGPPLWLPLPSPPDHLSCNKPEGYSLPVDCSTPPPLRATSRPDQASPRTELRIANTQVIAAGTNDGVPLSPKMVKVLGADGKEEEKIASYLKSQKNAMWWWSSLPSDSDFQRDSTSTHVHPPLSPMTKRRACNSPRPVMLHSENSGVANTFADRSGASANRNTLPGVRAQECATADWRPCRNSDEDNDLCNSPSCHLSPGTTGIADGSSTGKASPARESAWCSTPQRSPRKHLVGSQGKPVSPLHESFHKACKLPSPSELPLPSPTRPPPSPNQLPHLLDRRTQTLQHALGARPRSLPSLNLNAETSPLRYKSTSPTSPNLHDHKLASSAAPPPGPRNLTPPTSPGTLKTHHVKHVEGPDYIANPWNSPQRSIVSPTSPTYPDYIPSPRKSPQRSIISPTSPTYPDYIPSPRKSPQRSFISPTYQDSPGNTSPLHRFLQPVPKPPKRWKRGAKIGSGSFGCVYEGWNLDDGTFFAVKVSNSDSITPEIHQEVAMLSKLRHPNIVQYYGTTTEDGSICIFLELVKMGSLQSIMKNFQVFDEVLMSSYTRQILTGLEYLHDMNTVHRDIKCANILVDADGQVKLADFGLAKQMRESLATSIKGSPYYMAPEVLLPGRNRRPYGLAVDIWSLGCTVLEMADGKPPWSGLQGYAFFFKVTNGELPPIPEHLSDTAKDFITWCLQKRPEDRPTVKELLKHPFVAQAPRTFRASFPIDYQSK